MGRDLIAPRIVNYQGDSNTVKLFKGSGDEYTCEIKNGPVTL